MANYPVMIIVERVNRRVMNPNRGKKVNQVRFTSLSEMLISTFLIGRKNNHLFFTLIA